MMKTSKYPKETPSYNLTMQWNFERNTLKKQLNQRNIDFTKEQLLKVHFS